MDLENRDDVDVGDMMIVFTDDDGNVEYAINVSNSVDDLDGDGVKDDIFPELWTDPTGGYYPYAVFGYGLWNRIWDDATPIDYSEQLDAYQAAAATAIAMADDTAEQIAAKREALDYVKTILNAMMNGDEAKDALSAAEIVELSDTIKAVEDELARLGGVVDAADPRQSDSHQRSEQRGNGKREFSDLRSRHVGDDPGVYFFAALHRRFGSGRGKRGMRSYRSYRESDIVGSQSKIELRVPEIRNCGSSICVSHKILYALGIRTDGWGRRIRLPDICGRGG